MSDPRDNRALLVKLGIVAVAMFGFGYALVPFYEQICNAIGVNSLEERSGAIANTQVDVKRTVTIEFDANTHGMPWRFQPAVRHMEVHPGQLVQVEYEVANVRGTPVTGQAVASYGPRQAGQYFRKLECFCFTQQTLAGGETRRMPVTFVVDPALPAEINTITLSYTFFEVAGKG
jgi:cytochrome c oxidase assembly protein subunit 11